MKRSPSKKFKAEWGFTSPLDVKPPKKKFNVFSEEPQFGRIETGRAEPIRVERQPMRNTINENPWASMIPSTRKKSSLDLSNLIATGLSGVDALIPNSSIKNPVVQPYENYSYNQNKYGTGSQSLMKKGGKLKADMGLILPTIDDNPGKKKRKGLQNELNRNYQFSGVVDDNGKRIDNPTYEQSIKTMIQFMKNNWDTNAPNPSNNYIPEWQHHSYDPTTLPQMNTAKYGSKMTAKMGLQIEGNNYSKLSPSMFQVEGKSHAEGGTDLSFGGKTIEAEKGEPITLDKDGNLTIMGNLKNPLTNNKYKVDAKMLAKKENKAKVYFDKGLELINTQDPKGKYSTYAFNAGKVMMEGGKSKLNEIMSAKEHLGDLQNAHLQLIGEENKTAKNGITVYPDGGKWNFKGTNTKGLDAKIMDFVKIAEMKGLGGYSGPQSGVSQRNTKSGRLSRHAQKQALDMIFSDPNAYEKILKDPDLSGYLINNGLTAINEYDPNIASKTGATKGHIHIGYDKGTATSDKFRNDAKQVWSKDNPNWNWTNRIPSKGKPISNGIKGDMYDLPNSPLSTKLPYTDKTGTKFIIPPDLGTNSAQPEVEVNPQTPLKDYEFNFSNEKQKSYSNAKPLDLTNILGEAYSIATNQQEPVFMQQYQPDLYQPYQVSFQDRINQNNRTFNASQQLVGYNPEALSTLAGEVYNANNQVAADEFRVNQGIANDITNKNISLLNEAKGKNLMLADNQYVRQSTAKSNTKAVNQQALNSISSKVLQNKRENNTLKTYENLYPHYRFNENYQKDYVGPNASSAIDWQNVGNSNYNKEVQTINPDGSLKQIKRTVDPIELELKKEQLKKVIQKRTTPDVFEKGGKVNPRKWLSSI